MQRFTALHKAAQKGNVQEVMELLAEGADPRVRDSEGRTPLHHAVMRGHLGVVDELLAAAGPSALLAKDVLGCTPVHLAAVQNQVTLIMKLVNALLKDEKGTTPLHEVARRRCMQDFMGFLHLGWDLAARDDPGGNPPLLLAQLSPAWAEAAKWLNLDRPGLATVQQIMGWSPLHLAAMDGHVPLLHTLVEQLGCDVLERSANSWTPLHYAAAHNQVAAMEALVKLGCEPAIQDSVSSTPMHVAAGEGHLEAVQKLVDLGCDAGVRDRDGCTPLYCAAAWNRIASVRQLDRLGCPSGSRSEEGRTPTHVAAEQGWVDLIELLVRELRNKVDTRDTYQFTPLHSAANGGHVRAIQKLIQFNHDVDVKDYLGRTPLHYAAMNGRVAAVEELIKQGAAVREKDSRGGYTPLHLAADAGQCEVIVKLVELGAGLEAQTHKGWTPLVLATMKGPANIDAIGVLVELGARVDMVMENTSMETPLHIAARSGRVDIAAKLLRCGVPVSVRTKDGSTPLHYAAAFGQSHVIQKLVEAGCSPDCTDDAHNTPLHLAAGCGFLDTVVKLVELGADLNARDITACTPLQNAAHGTYSALAAMPVNQQQPNAQGGAHGQGSNSLLSPAVQGQHQSLTPAQAAAQMALSNGTAQPNGMVPVRTGLAWATLVGQNEVLSSMYMGAGAGGAAGEPEGGNDWRGLGLMQLLKRASRRRGGAQFSTGPADTSTVTTPGTVRHADPERDKERDCGLEALLKKTEALQLSSLEQDRARLIPVAVKMVELGAKVDAVDAEGRTALHLAAGCGDKNMVLKLVELGTDVNCRDSVGGTPMHHAAMANKKEMMFLLARLGCDWRARADGIDGATAAFVLCGQHGKTTRQQLVEAKLKRVYLEGMAARNAGQNAAALSEALEEAAETVTVAQADANMAALLEEVEEEGNKLAKRKKKKKKGKSKVEGGDDGLDDIDVTDATALAEAAAALTPASAHQPSTAKATSNGLAPVLGPASAPSVRSTQDSSAQAQPSSHPIAGLSRVAASSDRAASQAEHAHAGAHRPVTPLPTQTPDPTAAARGGLEAATCQAMNLLEIGAAAGEDVFKETLQLLDAAIEAASAANVSAKYGKKLRKRLQSLMDGASDSTDAHESDTAADAGPDGSSQAAGATEAAVDRQSASAAASTSRPTSRLSGQKQAAQESSSGRNPNHSHLEADRQKQKPPDMGSSPSSPPFMSIPPHRQRARLAQQAQQQQQQAQQRPKQGQVQQQPQRQAEQNGVARPHHAEGKAAWLQCKQPSASPHSQKQQAPATLQLKPVKQGAHAAITGHANGVDHHSAGAAAPASPALRSPRKAKDLMAAGQAKRAGSSNRPGEGHPVEVLSPTKQKAAPLSKRQQHAQQQQQQHPPHHGPHHAGQPPVHQSRHAHGHGQHPQQPHGASQSPFQPQHWQPPPPHPVAQQHPLPAPSEPRPAHTAHTAQPAASRSPAPAWGLPPVERDQVIGPPRRISGLANTAGLAPHTDATAMAPSNLSSSPASTTGSGPRFARPGSPLRTLSFGSGNLGFAPGPGAGSSMGADPYSHPSSRQSLDGSVVEAGQRSQHGSLGRDVGLQFAEQRAERPAGHVHLPGEGPLGQLGTCSSDPLAGAMPVQPPRPRSGLAPPGFSAAQHAQQDPRAPQFGQRPVEPKHSGGMAVRPGSPTLHPPQQPPEYHPWAPASSPFAHGSPFANGPHSSLSPPPASAPAQRNALFRSPPSMPPNAAGLGAGPAVGLAPGSAHSGSAPPAEHRHERPGQLPTGSLFSAGLLATNFPHAKPAEGYHMQQANGRGRSLDSAMSGMPRAGSQSHPAAPMQQPHWQTRPMAAQGMPHPGFTQQYSTFASGTPMDHCGPALAASVLGGEAGGMPVSPGRMEGGLFQEPFRGPGSLGDGLQSSPLVHLQGWTPAAASPGWGPAF